MAASEKTALQTAVAMLARRERCEAQIRSALERKGFDSGDIEPTLIRLRELGYLDDRAFAHRRAEKMLAGGQGPEFAVRRLAVAGIDEASARGAVERALGSRSERDLAAAALEERFPRLTSKSAREERLRAARWLVSRGYTTEVARALLLFDLEQDLE
jgi:regulatory protein